MRVGIDFMKRKGSLYLDCFVALALFCLFACKPNAKMNNSTNSTTEKSSATVGTSTNAPTNKSWLLDRSRFFQAKEEDVAELVEIIGRASPSKASIFCESLTYGNYSTQVVQSVANTLDYPNFEVQKLSVIIPLLGPHMSSETQTKVFGYIKSHFREGNGDLAIFRYLFKGPYSSGAHRDFILGSVDFLDEKDLRIASMYVSAHFDPQVHRTFFLKLVEKDSLGVITFIWDTDVIREWEQFYGESPMDYVDEETKKIAILKQPSHRNFFRSDPAPDSKK